MLQVTLKLTKKLWGFVRGYFLLFGFAALTGFIGSPQQIKSHASQPHGSSIKTISPAFFTLVFLPFLFAKTKHLQ